MLANTGLTTISIADWLTGYVGIDKNKKYILPKALRQEKMLTGYC